MNIIQEHQFNMALEVDRICKKHNIKYSLDGGTLLGAIRHKGFIPWDDDLDLNMLREDYDKFIEVAKKELDDKYFIQTADTDENYGFPMAKIREKNTIFTEEMAKNTKAKNGIFIDIFPFDAAPNNNTKCKLHLYRIIFLRMMLLLKCKYIIDTSTFVKKVEVLILNILKSFVTRNYLVKRIDKLSRKYNNKNTDYIITYSTVYFDKGKFRKEIYEEHDRYEFEGKKLMGTKYYDEYLTQLYGDYMTPPPKTNRDNRHGIIEIKINGKDIK